MSNLRLARVRAKRGARWLDENFPGWEKRINLNTLELANGEQCICGQVFKRRAKNHYGENGFEYASDHLFAEANSWITKIVPKNARFRAHKVSEALGFNVLGFSDSVDVTFENLETAWVELLAARKASV
jgi:hypothetical protein